MGVASGHQDLVIAAGVESASRVERGADERAGGQVVPPAPELAWRTTLVSRGVAAELVARRFQLTRGELDAFAL